MRAPPIATGDGLPQPQRNAAMVTAFVGIAMAVLDTAIANVALPSIARDVGASPAMSIWIVNAYQLAVVVTLLPLASLGDIVGYRKIYIGGLVVFTVASAACALSTSLLTLTLARVLQGFGASGIMSVNTAIVRMIWPQRMIGRGVGYNSMVVAVSSAVGPTVAAGILSVAPWPWLFAINIPLGLVALPLAIRALPDSDHSRHRFDWISAVLNAAAFGLVISGIDSYGHAERGVIVAAELGLGLVAVVLLVRRQLVLPLPLLPVDLLRIPIFAMSVGTSVCAFCAQALAIVSLPFLLQDVAGHGEVMTGLLMTPWPLALALTAPISGRLADRTHPSLLGGIGLAILGVGLALLAMMPANTSAIDIAWRMAMCGMGFGLFQSPNNRTMVLSAPKERSGGAGGMLSTARLLGQTLGAALVALVFGLFPTHGTRDAIAVGAVFAVGALLASSLRLSQPNVAPRAAAASASSLPLPPEH